VQDWKVHTMAQKVLHAVFDDPEGTLRKAAAIFGLGAAGVGQTEVLRDKSIIEEKLKKGWVLVCVDGYPLGWAKYTGTSLKNKYYPGWRWQ